MINFYSCDILVGFLGQVIYVLLIKPTPPEQIAVIEQVAAALLYWEHFKGSHKDKDWIVFFIFSRKFYNSGWASESNFLTLVIWEKMRAREEKWVG